MDVIKNIDIDLIVWGEERCKKKHSWGPAMRDHHLFHYICSGTGEYEVAGKKYYPIPGEIFYIPPKTICRYEADDKDPWHYKWFGFIGKNSSYYCSLMGVSVNNPVIKCDKNVEKDFDCLLAFAHENNKAEARSLGYTYLLIQKIIDLSQTHDCIKTNADIYVENAIQFILTNIHKKITVLDLASYIGIDRSYFCAIFCRKMGISPQEYIMDMKMKKACEFMLTTPYPIKYIASSVGYSDQYVFSHAFKKRYGLSPRDYRNSHENMNYSS